SIGAYMQFDRALYEQQGVGMGFYLAKRMVELHGGEFEVHSGPGKGTGVQFTIPT
ncbi:MAG: ATP-binding protein, partial [Anaerolineae bacterium]|nr:ATP-binding protein [Anaerolineae bacterium]